MTVPGHQELRVAEAPMKRGGGLRRKSKVAGGKRRDEHQMVPDATFTSYYGRPVVKASPWKADIPAYLFMGGVAGGSSLLAAGADLTDRPELCRVARVGALMALVGSLGALVHDLGRPSRFMHMLRVFKPTSPMSVGTWLVSAYAPFAGLAVASELMPTWLRRTRLGGLIDATATPAGVVAAVIAPTVAAYTAVLLSDTATPTWHDARGQLPTVFVGSAASAAGGLGMLGPVREAGPARRMAVGGALVELVAAHRMEHAMGLTGEPLSEGTAGRLMQASRALTVAGTVGTLVLGRRRTGAAASGLALLAGSALLRFGIFEAGQASARDPRFTIVPQRERLDARARQEAATRDVLRG